MDMSSTNVMKRTSEGWTKLHDEETQYLCTSPNIIMVLKSTRIRWDTTQTGKRRYTYQILERKPQQSDYLQDIGLDGG
jgi:hypothetical protein